MREGERSLLFSSGDEAICLIPFFSVKQTLLLPKIFVTVDNAYVRGVRLMQHWWVYSTPNLTCPFRSSSGFYSLFPLNLRFSLYLYLPYLFPVSLCGAGRNISFPAFFVFIISSRACTSRLILATIASPYCGLCAQLPCSMKVSSWLISS